jgi:AraC-like DNA-binding protein
MQIPEKEYFHYIPVSEWDVQWGLYVTGVGCGTFPGDKPYPQRVHPDLYQYTWEKGRILPEYQIVYIERGEGIFESPPSGKLAVRGPCLLMTFPGVWHRYRPTGKAGWSECWLGLSGEHLHRLLRQGFISPKTPIMKIDVDVHLRKAWDSLFEQVRQDVTRTHSIAAGAMLILAEALEAAQVRPVLPDSRTGISAAEDALVAEAIQWIWDHSQRPMIVKNVVAQLPVTRRSLERRFRRAVGHSILDEINRCRFERAKLLLKETDLPIKGVASSAGFSRTKRMNEVFLRNLGISAANYRLQIRQESPTP